MPWDTPDNLVKDINDFHKKFVPDLTPDFPQALSKELSDFRIGFMLEELNEYIEAVETNDLEGQLDALVDLVYVAIGTAWKQGFPFSEAWDEVQRANMSKERSTADPNKQTKRKSKYDIYKPEGWIGPDITRVLNNQFQLVQDRMMR